MADRLLRLGQFWQPTKASRQRARRCGGDHRLRNLPPPGCRSTRKDAARRIAPDVTAVPPVLRHGREREVLGKLFCRDVDVRDLSEEIDPHRQCAC